MTASFPLFPGAHPERLRRIFERTEIRRAPLTGIIRGYHTLPFSLIGPGDTASEGDEPSADSASSQSSGTGSVLLTGKISVSPRLVIPVTPEAEHFGDAFPEEEPFMDRDLVGRVFAFSRWQTTMRIVLPAAVPGLFSAVRQGVMQAWLTVIFVELLASSEGLGFFMAYSRSLGQIDLVIVSMFVIGALGLGIDAVLKLFESRLLGWRRSAY